jgi:hypothetical protein
MIFAFATDDRILHAFATPEDGIAYCESVDIEGGNWLFFAANGQSLAPRVTRRSTGRFLIAPGSYVLEASEAGPALKEILDQVACVEGCGLTSVEAVRSLIAAAG